MGIHLNAMTTHLICLILASMVGNAATYLSSISLCQQPPASDMTYIHAPSRPCNGRQGRQLFARDERAFPSQRLMFPGRMSTRLVLCKSSAFVDGHVEAATVFSGLAKLANETVEDSYNIMDDTNFGNSPRSASGGTTVSPRQLPYSSVGQWADGGWVLSEHLPKLIKLVNDTFPNAEHWGWLEKSREPFVIELVRSFGVDITLIFVPAGGVTLPWRHATGTLVVCKTLFGEVELVQMLGDPHGRIPMRQATRTKVDQDVKRYLGGPPRIVGDAGTLGGGGSCLLEVALKSRSPMLGDGNYGGGVAMRGFIQDATGYENSPPVLRIGVPTEAMANLLVSRQKLEERKRQERAAAVESAAAAASHGAVKPGWSVQGVGIDTLRRGVGGLDDQVKQIVRRAFLTRTLPPGTMSELGLNHVRGMLLYGPPGCGKTLIARLISESLTDRPVKIVNGPELLDRWVGEAERNVRSLFLDAEAEWTDVGEASGLHVVVFDELDSLARKRGTLPGDSTGVRDSIVNQLLAKIDGVREMDNVLIIGLTNRKDLIDEALIRPGRLEVHVEIGPPDAAGRKEIIEMHMLGLRESRRLGKGAWELAEELGKDRNTAGYTGAELAGLVRCAASYAFERELLQDGGRRDLEVGVEDLERALTESRGGGKAGALKRAWKRLVGG